MPFDAEFGRRLRQEMGGRTQSEVAQELGVTQAYVSRMTQGHVPKRDIVERLISALNLDRSEWLALAGYADSSAGRPQPHFTQASIISDRSERSFSASALKDPLPDWRPPEVLDNSEHKFLGAFR